MYMYTVTVKGLGSVFFFKKMILFIKATFIKCKNKILCNLLYVKLNDNSRHYFLLLLPLLIITTTIIIIINFRIISEGS